MHHFCQAHLIRSHVRTSCTSLVPKFVIMGGKEWPTLVQKIFLASWLSRYLEAAAKGSYTKLWPMLFEAWFKVNPARLAPLPNLDSDSEAEAHCSDDEDTPPVDPKSEEHKALIGHLRGLSPEKCVAWQEQQGLIRDQHVCISSVLLCSFY